MCDYIIRTDGPMRFDVFLYLRGTNQYTVQELGKHGRFIDVDAYIKTEMDNYRKHRDEYSLERAEAISDVLAVLDKYTPIVLEASE